MEAFNRHLAFVVLRLRAKPRAATSINKPSENVPKKYTHPAMPTLIGMAGWVYFFGTFSLGLLMLVAALGFARNRSTTNARCLLKASILYLPLLLGFILLDAGFHWFR